MKTTLRHLSFLLLLALTTSCGIFQDQMELRFQESDALFVSLKDETVRKGEEVGQDSLVKADFWMEMNYPEIGAIGVDFQGIPHEGDPTELMVLHETEYKDLKRVPDKHQWQNHIPGQEVEEGLVFLVRDRFSSIYKVKLTKFDRDARKTNFAFEKLDE